LGLSLKEHYELMNEFGLDIITLDIEVKNIVDVFNLKQNKESENVNN